MGPDAGVEVGGDLHPQVARRPGRPRPRPGRRWRLAVRYALLTLGAVVVLAPLYLTVVNSLLPPSALAERPPPFFPLHPRWHDYPVAWSQGHLGVYLRNSAIQTVIIVCGQLVTSVLAGYAFAFVRFPFRRVLFVVFLATLMIPFEVTLVTNTQTISSLGWYNTFEGLAVPFLATGFGTFLVRQAFLQIPRDLREAATLDGYGHLRFMLRVAVPLARPALAALGVFSFLAAWNQYLWPLVVTGSGDNVRTVQIGLKLLQGTQVSHTDVALAGTVIAVAPLVVLLVAFQKQLVRSLTGGAVK
ncbi:MAG TPA: carbohydrate ABC transporter permease [Acidimicrobiales bacterium]|nr:carbohydrate ABC transporter permease [Acidimicrobiales bacterium]